MNKIIEALKVIRDAIQQQQTSVDIWMVDITDRGADVMVREGGIDTLAKEYSAEITIMPHDEKYNKRFIMVDGVKIFELRKKEVGEDVD